MQRVPATESGCHAILRQVSSSRKDVRIAWNGRVAFACLCIRNDDRADDQISVIVSGRVKRIVDKLDPDVFKCYIQRCPNDEFLLISSHLELAQDASVTGSDLKHFAPRLTGRRHRDFSSRFDPRRSIRTILEIAIGVQNNAASKPRHNAVFGRITAGRKRTVTIGLEINSVDLDIVDEQIAIIPGAGIESVVCEHNSDLIARHIRVSLVDKRRPGRIGSKRLDSLAIDLQIKLLAALLTPSVDDNIQSVLIRSTRRSIKYQCGFDISSGMFQHPIRSVVHSSRAILRRGDIGARQFGHQTDELNPLVGRSDITPIQQNVGIASHLA